MYIPCPEGWQRVAPETYRGVTLTVHRSKVQIYAGVCDSCDLCGITTCRFYDTSREATRRFMRAQADEHTLEHLLKQLRPN